MNRPLKILQVISSNVPSGAEIHVKTISRELANRGHDVTVVLPPGGWLNKQLLAQKTPIIELPLKGLNSLSSRLKLFNLIKANQYDIAHTHLGRAAMFTAPAVIFNKTQLIYTVHVVHRDFASRIAQSIGGHIVAVSDAVKQNLMNNGIKPSTITTVHNGVEEPDIETKVISNLKSEFNLSGNDFLIGLVGRVCKEKGHMLAVEALQAVIEKYPTAKLLFIGRIEPKFKPVIENEINSRNLCDNIILTNNRNDVSSIMSVLDIIILPSYSEGFGLVLLEAMALSKPIIASKVGGIPEAVIDGLNGELIPLDAKELSTSIIDLLSNPIKAIEMGQNGYERYRENFTTKIMVNKLEELYNSKIKK